MLTRVRRFLGLFFIVVLGCVSLSWATTYAISNSTGSDSNSCLPASPCNTLKKATSLMVPGDVLKFMGTSSVPQTYSISSDAFNVTNLSTGSLTTYTTFMAENDGGAIISADLAMQDSATPLQSHLIFEGFKFTSTNQKNIYGDHLAFKRCAFKGGPSSGNTVNTAVGGNNNGSNLTRYVLLEDCWWYGAGGRYDLLIFNSENIVTRRTVIRHEGNYTYDGSDPESGFALYNSSACDILNMNLVDNTTNYTVGWTQPLYFIHNASASPDHVVIGNNITGFAIIGARSVGMRSDATTSSSNAFTDGVVVNSEDFAFSWGSNNNTTATGTRLAAIRHNMSFASAGGAGGFGYFGSGGGITLTNVLVSTYTSGADYNGISPTFFDTFNNGSTASGTGRQTYDPSTHGFLYPFRVEAGSSLLTDGTGGQIGPNIVNKLGADGTFWGEANYNTDTGNALWPWPYETRIKTDLQDTSPGWGFSASTETLTQYEWEILGNSMPTNIYPTISPEIIGKGFSATGIKFIPN